MHHRGTFWGQLQELFTNSSLQLPPTQPVWATTSYQENPVTLLFTLNAIMGMIDIYQLEPSPMDSNPVTKVEN